MKKRIVVEKGKNEIKFYLHTDQGCLFMFAHPFTKGIYNYFKNGRSQNEIMNYNRWDLNPKLDDLIDYMPLFIDYMCEEYNLDNRNNRRKRIYSRTDEKESMKESNMYQFAR